MTVDVRDPLDALAGGLEGEKGLDEDHDAVVVVPRRAMSPSETSLLGVGVEWLPAGQPPGPPAPVAFRTEAPRRVEVDPWRRFVRDVVRGGVLIVLVHLFVVQISVVRGHSMQPSLQDGDRLVVDRVSYHMIDVSRFDVVVLRYPADPSIDFVKRVVGLPGDRVRVTDGRLFVNGKAIDEGFTHISDTVGMAERTVPQDHYLVLGDNRPISCDSREFGMVSHELLKGKVRACFWPPSRVDWF